MANKKQPYSKKSVNGEPNPHLKQSHASGSEQSLGDSLIEYNQPESSPYESPTITIRIGHRTYRIPVCYVQNYPQFSSPHPWEPHYTLSEVDDEVGHTIVHFLCTGNYETLRTASETGVSKIAIEYRRSMLVYEAANKYGLYDLAAYAKKYIEMFGKSMTIFDRMEAAREIYSKLPTDEIWLAGYIYKQLRIAFSLDTNIFHHEEFYLGVGKDPVFDKAVMRMVVNIYSEALSREVDETTPEGSIAEEGAAEDCAVEDGAVEDGAVEEGAAEEAVDIKIPAEPSGTEWGENWVSSSKLELLPLHTGNGGMGKDTNLWPSKNKAEESVGFTSPYEEIKYEKKDKNKESKKGKKTKKNKRNKVEEPAETADMASLRQKHVGYGFGQ
ncbi:hypothetical protein KXV55_002216 [Aspergillus fumigatus]|nr:hypothetical protein KXV55_002216 [Aspergillus fumigatus]